MSTPRLFVIVAIVLVVLLAAAEGLVRSIGLEARRSLLQGRLSDAIGRDVTIRGDLRLGLLGGLRLVATDVVVANPPDRASPHLVEIGSVDLDLSAWRLLGGVIEVKGLHLLDADLYLEPDSAGRLGLVADVEALTEEPPTESMALRVQALEIERLRVFYRSRPGADLVTARFDVVSMRAEPIEGPLEVEIRGHLDGGPFDLKGRFGSLDELLDPTEPYPARVEGRILEAELQADGTVAEPRRLRGVDLAVSGRIPDLALLSESLDRELPKTGPVAVDVRLVNPDGRFALLDLRLATERPGPLGVVLTGSIRDLRELRGVDLDLELRAEGTDVLQALAERNIGGIGLLDADLVVSDADGTLGVEGEVHARGRDDSITLDLEGGQDDLSRIREIDVRAGLRARDIRVIADALGVEKSLPPIGPVVATGRFRDHDGAVGLYDIDVRVGSRDEAWAELSGSVADVINMAGLEIEARFGAVDLRHARHFLEREPPAIGGLEGMARASDRDGSLGIEHFTIGAGTHELVRIDVSGSFDHLREVDEITLQARVSARDLELFGQLLNADLPSIGPVEFEGSVTGSNESMKSRGTARLDETILKGRWSASFATGERPRIWGRVTSPHVRLRDVGIEPRHEPLQRVRGTDAGDVRGGASRSLPFERLRALDADVELRADRVTGRAGLEITDVTLSLRLEDGELMVPHFDGTWNGGALDAELRVDSRTPDPTVVLNWEATGMDVGRLASQLEDQPGGAGIVDALLALRSEGRTPAELRKNLAGKVWLVVRDGVTTANYVNQFLLTMLRISLPSLQTKEVVEVGCTVGEFDVEDGIATVGTLVLSGPQATVTGEGSVDIGRGRYDLRLTPRVRDPGLVSVAVSVDVTGPLEEPQFRPVKRTIATSAVRALANNLLRPGRFAMERLWTNGSGEDEDICARAQASRPDIQPLTARTEPTSPP
jgi:hypothetical protein